MTDTSKTEVAKVTIRSIYDTLSYADKLVVYSHYGDNLDNLVIKKEFLDKLAKEKSKRIGR